MDPDFVNRINELVERAGGQTALARKTGMSLGAIQRYIKGGEPTRVALIKLVETCDVSLNWLVYGRETADYSKQPGSHNLKLYGFGEEAAQEGWYNEVEYKIMTELGYPDPDCFAVVVADDSLNKVGISKGNVCIVSPHTLLKNEDIVFVRSKDRQATLKLFQKEDSEWVYVNGWFIDQSLNASQYYEEQIKKSTIDVMGPVVFIKRR